MEALKDVPPHYEIDMVSFSEGINAMRQLYIPTAVESDDPYDDEWEVGRIPAIEIIA